MPVLALLVCLPLAFGAVLYLIPHGRLSKAVLVAATLLQAAVALYFTVQTWGQGRVAIRLELPFSEYAILAVELLLAAFFAVSAIRKGRILPLLLALVQAGLALGGESWTASAHVESPFIVDQMALLMVLVIGIVGGLIVIHSVGYMERYHEEHPELKDRRRMFGSVFLIFLGAMYGLVLADDLRIMLLFWEITTWASFLLIGYNGDEVGIRNSFLALTLNLVGGIAFAIGNIVLASSTGSLSLSSLGQVGASVAALPLACLALAGLVKSAQLPFTPWLLGAMVAPSPVSALLHSSTMVKAGVFLLIRLAPALAGKFIGDMVALVGILTFMTSAFIAVSQRNSKRVLALSTVSNLGLIVVCAGIGTPQLMWAAFFLILFHAIAKALLFLGVGTVSIGTGSLDIEEMGGLVVTMPRVAVLLVIGIAGMFVAPFGMLISKWTAMEALISLKSMISPILITALAFGSATTVFFWTKWLGTIIRVSDPTEPRGLQETRTTIPERFAELSLALLAMLSFLSFSLVSRFMAEPFLRSSFAGEGFSLGSDNVIIASLMVAMTILLPALTLFVASRRHTVLSGAYMSGRSSEAGLVFKGSAGIERKVDLRAYYLEKFFAERRLLPAGIGIGILMLIIMFGTVLL